MHNQWAQGWATEYAEGAAISLSGSHYKEILNIGIFLRMNILKYF